MPSFNWEHFEQQLAASAGQSLLALMESAPGEQFYGAAFHEFYSEEHDAIHLPLLAANTVQTDPQCGWNSPDWKYTAIPYETAEIRMLQQAMQDEAADLDLAGWYEMHERFLTAFVNVVCVLKTKIAAHKGATPEFAMFVLEMSDEHGVDLLRRSATQAEFERHFPDLVAMLADEEAIANLPLEERLAIYRANFSGNQKKIVALGEAAIPMLIEAMSDATLGWNAVDLLGKIGIHDKRAIDILHQRALEGSEMGFHETIALTLLGDIDFVLQLADHDLTRAIAVRGLCSLYSSIANECRRTIPLDYAPLERLLQKPGCAELVLRTNRGGRSIQASDVDAALAGLGSQHAVVRESAVRVLGDRGLGKEVGERVLPALAERLQDTDSEVRKLAVLALLYWRKAALSYAPAIRALCDDPKVGQTASYVICEFEALAAPPQ